MWFEVKVEFFFIHSFQQHLLKKIILFPVNSFRTFVENAKYTQVCFWNLHFGSLFYMFIICWYHPTVLCLFTVLSRHNWQLKLYIFKVYILTSLIIKEVESKTSVRYNLTLVRAAVIKRQGTNTCEIMEKSTTQFWLV